MGNPLPHHAILGGTFDPIHVGHLRAALELRERLQLTEVRLVPCHWPPHRGQPGASSEQRLAMVQAAVADEPGLAADDRELRRAGPSYSIDTLAELRAELGAAVALSLIVGADAFAGLDSWHRWQELPTLAHLVVIDRPGFELPRAGAVYDFWQARQRAPARLATTAAGGVSLVRLPPLPVSATAIRAAIAAGRSPRWLLPDPVWDYIRRERLYHDQSPLPPMDNP